MKICNIMTKDNRRNCIIKAVLRLAACALIGIIGVWVGRNYLPLFALRKTVSSRTAEIVQAKPWIADVEKQARGRLTIFVFKKEQTVEVHAPGWIKPRKYDMTGFSGNLGPKLKEGDGQIPEGVYGIDYLNPNSMFHLSLKVSYPNTFDRKQAEKYGRSDLGGDIMIHGGSATVGCIPIGDDAIEELFYFVAMIGKENVTVVIAPYDMRNGRKRELEKSALPWYGELCDKISKALTT